MITSKQEILTNEIIYNLALRFSEAFNDDNEVLPIAINFAIQKNKQTLLKVAEEIEENRIKIINKYGDIEESGAFKIKEDFIDKANEELSQLLSIQQEVKIYKVGLLDFGELNLSIGEMKTLMFMIEDEE